MENQENFNSDSSQLTNKPQLLPKSIMILITGIGSIIWSFAYGIPGTIHGIIALVLCGKANKLLQQNPELYSASSIKMFKAGRTCAIIGTIFSVVMIVVYAFFIYYIVTHFYHHNYYNDYSY